ncbi:MAG TPA: EAL domain-containing protein [Xanthobacteraceae bacterium]|jgi:EAL domain-containing protein (putative c-di-GMP-specific phosphodiesterase class I)
MLKALRGLFADAKPAAVDDDERDASGKPVVTLAKALKRGWLEVWYQPKVSLQTHNWVGAEGLIRARHPELGVLGPGAFLPGAGDDEMLEMTRYVILTALRDWCDCAALGMPALSLAVNVPASGFLRLPIAQLIREGRPRSDQWPGLILEVTEDEIVNDLKMANEVANELRAQSCSLAIDDFGAGYSSLGRLRQLPFGELKIDRAYVTDCNRDKVKEGLLESIIDVARRFGLKTVAEGIETHHESHKLQGLGVMVGQGFLFARPMAKADFLAKIAGTTGKRIAPQPRPWWQFGAASA